MDKGRREVRSLFLLKGGAEDTYSTIMSGLGFQDSRGTLRRQDVLLDKRLIKRVTHSIDRQDGGRSEESRPVSWNGVPSHRSVPYVDE